MASKASGTGSNKEATPTGQPELQELAQEADLAQVRQLISLSMQNSVPAVCIALPPLLMFGNIGSDKPNLGFQGTIQVKPSLDHSFYVVAIVAMCANLRSY